jgi:uncharacterized C2H2 Zn-finger protein
MADDETTFNDVPEEIPTEGDAPAVDRGACPICKAEFDDPDVFRDHLANAHGLHDDEGASTALWSPEIMMQPITAAAPVIRDDPAPPPEVEAAPDGEPSGDLDPSAGDRGHCPICDATFDDADVFRDHLADAHGLHDDEGVTTGLWIPPPIAIVPATEFVPPTIPDDDRPRRAVVVPRRRRRAPVGRVALIVLLLALGGAVVLSTRSDDGSRTLADAPDPATSDTSKKPPADGTSSTGRRTTSTTISSATGVTAGESTTSTSARPREHVPVTQPVSTTTTPATTAPKASYVAPTTSSAHVDHCSRSKGDWIVTFSWKYVGGSAWKPLGTYKAVAGGRYQHTVSVPANRNTPITSVGVVDSTGKRHSVALSPALSAESC